MNPRTSLTTCTGKMIDLLDPKAGDIDFAVIAEHLSKANRYCGATRGIVYSVAEHSVRCADAALLKGDGNLAAYLLCHDMHEAFLGDDTTPKKRALAHIAETQFGALAGHIRQSFDALTDRLDVAIHEAAGLSWPPNSGLQAAIKRFDTIMLATEWRDLMQCELPYDFGVPPLPHPIAPMSWQAAEQAFLDRCRALLPALRGSAS